jgi:GNAT superfamily N-acetyltransferase
MRWELRPVPDLTADERAAYRALSLAVYPPEFFAAWPGRGIEWAAPQWGVIGWDAVGEAVCYVGVFLREARWDDRTVKVGGIGGVKTHPAFRGRGFATTAIGRALDFFREQGDVDFGLLVCEPSLVPFYERLGWHSFPGDLIVTQHGATVPFTFNLAMTTSIGAEEPLTGTIDPWDRRGRAGRAGIR